MTRQGIANRIRRLERHLGLKNTPAGGQASAPTWTYPQHLALFGPFARTDPEQCRPIYVLKDAGLVRWLRQVDPERLRKLKHAYATGEPVPPLEKTAPLNIELARLVRAHRLSKKPKQSHQEDRP
jgi:hypothetical protein